jgi:poly(3-hydroxybutyrate) depolymerase
MAMTIVLVRPFILTVALAVALSAQTADKVSKETFGSGGHTRTYYLLVPGKAKANAPAPLVVLLHGSGRDGKSLTSWWEKTAREEGFAIVAPDATVRQGWGMSDDGPDFLHNLVEMLRVQHEIDPRRIYLFGHSAGAVHGLLMGLLEPDYFAAVAVHAGAVPADGMSYLDRAGRRIPMAIWVGTEDAFFPLSVVRATKTALASHGFPVQLNEMTGHTHDYYSRAPAINKAVWSFLQMHKLTEDPQFQQYEVKR